jgi:CubicO group peptidase (beta-lactamase class C family)
MPPDSQAESTRFRARHGLLRKPLPAVAAFVLTAATMLPLVRPARADDSARPNGSAAPISLQGPTDPGELGTFLDGLLAKQMGEFHIAGAAVAVVKDGRLFYSKGYGYADLENRIPVDPGQTLFRIGSVSKLFTWTAVMQLVEQGKLDLNADINTYLDFRIPATYPQPITLRNLITHTSGLEDRLIGSVAPEPNDLVSARDWLVSHMAARVNPPGVFAGYSNYNAELAGYIVARVAGETYDQYVQTNILDVLGMRHSSARSTMPADLLSHRSVGYTYAGGDFQAFPDYVVQAGSLPSGGIQASVTDMARFMIAQLQGGSYRDEAGTERRILSAATTRQMQTTQYTAAAGLLGTAYGFFDLTDNGVRTLGHQGYEPPMHSLMLLMPDQRLGVFVTYNTATAGPLTLQHTGFQRAFFDHYYPAPPVAPIQPPAGFAARADRFVGSYRYASAPATTLNKIAAFIGAYTVDVSNPGDGTLLVNVQGVGERFVEVSPLRFRELDGPFLLVFGEDAQGRITSLATDLEPQYAALRLEWYETAGFNMILLLALVLAFLSAVLVAAVRPIWRRLRRVDRPTAPSRAARTASRVILAISLLNLGVVAGTFAWVMQPSELHPPTLGYEVVLGMGVLSAVLTVGAVVLTVLSWKDRYGGLALRVHHSLVTVAAVAFVWFLNNWNMLGWRY